MAYVPSFEHDVFISYAHADNQNGRVTAFRDSLVQYLTSALGSRAFHKPKEWVFFDQTGLKTGDEFSPKLEHAARRSAVMISLLSNSYLQAKWCIKETEWFEEAGKRARDPIERRLIPLILDGPSAETLSKFTRFQQLLRGDLNDPGLLSKVCGEIGTHFTEARKKHGFVFLGQACKSSETTRNFVIDELRGFDCGPVDEIFGQKTALRQSLAEAKIAVHLLGDCELELPDALETILLSLEHCRGKTIGYLPPGSSLAPDEAHLIEHVRNHERWTMPKCTPTELVQILTRELESFLLPEPAIPIALACDRPDLQTVRALAREIHEKAGGAFAVATPDFIADPGAMAFVEWRRYMTQNPSALVYWGQGEKDYLDRNIALYLRAAKFGRAWYVSGTDPEAKVSWQPDAGTDKIPDADQPFDFEKLKPFLQRVRENARK
jgi:hypothetical protein